ncbi:MAG: hypothetical protein WA947_12555 [Phormidesmis sp.]
MINPASETFGQARHGSVAAIIQVLNEQLASDGIRTRAVVADGMLQILCEAATAKQLDQTTVVGRVRDVLEAISPNRIRKVKINSRIVKEEQLLWLEEINRDPENALLWSEIITLKQPFFVQRWVRDRNLRSAGPLIKDVTDSEPAISFSTKLVSGLALAALLIGALWLFKEELGLFGGSDTVANTATIEPEQPTSEGTLAEGTSAENTLAIDDADQDPADRTANTTPSSLSESGDRSPAATQPNQTTPTAQTNSGGGSPGPTEDAFAEAVRIAGNAAEEGLTASNSADWLALASSWQRASDLMSEIPAGNDRYDVAQDRVTTYKANSKAALQKAEAAQ